MNLRSLLITTLSALIGLSGIGLIGCAQKKSSPTLPPPPPRIEYYTHSINYQGETLAMIAKWYTGSSANWQNILDHNPGLDPKKMRIGMDVRIPRNLLIKEKRMPKPSVTLNITTPEQINNNLTPPSDSTVEDTQSARESQSETTRTLETTAQEDALKLQEQALKESEQIKEETQEIGTTESQNKIEESINQPNFPSNLDQSLEEPPTLPASENSETTPKKASMTDLLKKMLGGKKQGQQGTPEVISPPPSVSNDTSTDNSLPSTDLAPSDGKVKSRDELLKELTQDY